MKVYELFKDSLFSTSIRVLKNEHDAQDIVHDAFIKAFKAIEKFKEGTPLEAWLKRIAINCALDFLRKKKKVNWLDDMQAVQEYDDTEEEMKEYPSIQEIKNAINELKDKYRIIVMLYLIEDYPHKEIAQMLDLNESTVRNQYRRGKDQLRTLLAKKSIS